jgi:tRNA(Ile2) C34 agmatinyltransferase TiaS
MITCKECGGEMKETMAAGWYKCEQCTRGAAAYKGEKGAMVGKSDDSKISIAVRI